jgi:hypothetical protein
MSSLFVLPSMAGPQPLPLPQENIVAMAGREALDNVCELLGGMTAWVARHDADGCNLVMLLDPSFGIDSELQTALEIVDIAWHYKSVHIKPWKGDTLLYASFPVWWHGGIYLHSVGILFAGRLDLTERTVGVVEGLRSCLQSLFSLYLSDTCLNSNTRMPAPTVVCSCCRRAQSPKYGWMQWDDLRLIETGLASSHTVCEQCASELYEEVLRSGP